MVHSEINRIPKLIAKINDYTEQLKELNDKLRDHFDTTDLDIFYQPSDGWVILSEGLYNTPLRSISLSYLLLLPSYEEAAEYLKEHSI